MTRRRVLVIAYDQIGPRMAGPGIRSWNIAVALGARHDVTIASRDPIDRTHPDVSTVQLGGDAQLNRLLNDCDAVIVQGLALRNYPVLRHTNCKLFIDLYDPWIFENVQIHRLASAHDCTRAMWREADILNEQIDAGDFFFCASERQRDYWLGLMTSRGRIDLATWDDDPELRNLIDVVPYGCPVEPPAPGVGLKGSHPAIGPSDPVILWSGGVWEWFDPILAVDALAEAVREVPNLRLYFMGMALAGRTATMPVATAVRERATELDLDDNVVFGDWIPYDERGAILLDADAAVLATKPTAETRLSFRSRVLDHFWAGLPTITTPGDVLAARIDERGAGAVVPFGDVDAIAREMVRLVTDREHRVACASAALSLADDFHWNDVVRPIDRMLVCIESLDEVARTRVEFARAAGSELPARSAPVALHVGGAPAIRAARAEIAHRPHGRLIESLKRTRMYPALRRARRSSLGRRLWGPVLGEE